MLIDFFGDEPGRYWQCRLLLARGLAPAQWIVGIPVRRVQAALLSEHRAVPLRPNGAFPAAYAGHVYALAHDIPDASLDDMCGQAAALAGSAWLAALFGPGVAGGVAAAPDPCVDSDAAHADYGEEVPPAATCDAQSSVTRGGVALVQIDGSSAAFEYTTGLHAAGFGPSLYAGGWESSSGTQAAGAAAEHRNLLVAIRLALFYDQLDLPAMAVGVFLLRRPVQVETAVRRSPLSPDLSDLEYMLSAAVNASGFAVPIEFTRWSTSLVRDDAQALRQSSPWGEVQVQRAKKGKGKGREAKGGTASDRPPADEA